MRMNMVKFNIFIRELPIIGMDKERDTMKTFKQITALILALALSLPLCGAACAERQTRIAGSNVSWSLSQDGVLTLSGSGATPDYVYRDTERPWDVSAVTTVIVSDGVTGIGDGLFESHYNMKVAVLPDSVTNIGERAFMDCSSLAQIVMPQELDSLGKWAFYGCSALTGITIPKGISSIEERTFCDTALLAAVIPEGVRYIEREAFSDCSSLQSVIFPSTLKSIGSLAFSWCPALTSVELPAGCQADNAFDDGIQVSTSENKSGASLGIHVSVNDTITLGCYQQCAINWTVLAVEGNQALLVSTLALDVQPYDDGSTAQNTTWEDCSLRRWLNTSFLSAAFTESEQQVILTTTVSNPGYTNSSGQYIDGGNDTQDKLFLLSMDEVKAYFVNDDARRAGYTAYAASQGANVYDSYGYCYWWLRSPGLAQNRAAGVSVTGLAYRDGSYVNYPYAAIRPAMWVRLY